MDKSNKLVLKGRYIQRRESVSESKNDKDRTFELDKPFLCDLCDKKFWTKQGKATHLLVHTGEKPFECEVCLKKFSQKGNFKNHYKVHVKHSLDKDKNLTSSSPKKQLYLTQKQKIVNNFTAEYLYPCRFCDKKFPSETYLSVHNRIHTKEKPFECTLCRKRFSQAGNLKTHLLVHTKEKPFQCNVCPKSFCQKANLQVHYYRIHAKEKRLNFKQLTYQTPETENTNFEIVELANLNESGRKECLVCDKIIDKKYVCGISRKSFFKNQILSLHDKVHLATVTRQSSSVNDNTITIGKAATAEVTLSQTSDRSMKVKTLEAVENIQDSNKSDSINNSSEKLLNIQEDTSSSNYSSTDVIAYEIDTKDMYFICKKCGKRFKGRPSFLIHYRVHSGVRLYKCGICNKKFNQSQSLTFHLKIHSGEKPFKCDICDKTFRQKPNLMVHLRVHTGEKPFQCDICSKTFSQKNALIVHARVHSGEKPFQCEKCIKTFSLKSGLILHSRVHSGEKQFQCEKCIKTFTQKSALILHSRVHSGEKLFQCEKCIKTFSQKSGLILHSRVHSGEKPY